MSEPQPAQADNSQLKTFETLAKIRMAWVALWFALALFSVGFMVFVVALFMGKDKVATAASGAIDGMLGWVLKQVYSHLFPTPTK